MKGCPTPKYLAVIVAAVCVALLAGSAFAQYQTGNIYGKVQAKDGSVLPGVTVTLTGVAAPQTIVSDSQGSFHFLNLAPGLSIASPDPNARGGGRFLGSASRCSGNFTNARPRARTVRTADPASGRA